MKYYKTLSLGCKVNTYEVQAIKELLNQNFISGFQDERPFFRWN